MFKEETDSTSDIVVTEVDKRTLSGQRQQFILPQLISKIYGFSFSKIKKIFIAEDLALILMWIML